MSERSYGTTHIFKPCDFQTEFKDDYYETFTAFNLTVVLGRSQIDKLGTRLIIITFCAERGVSAVTHGLCVPQNQSLW